MSFYRSHGGKQNGHESESSDLSSVELEILQPTFAIQRSSAPVVETPVLTAHKIVPDNKPRDSYLPADKHSLNPKNTDIELTNSSFESDRSKNSWVKRQEDSTLRNSAPVNAVLRKTEVANNTNKPEQRGTEKKGEVSQVDFRGVLKRNVAKNDVAATGKLETNLKSPKLREKEETTKLSQKRALFEKDNQENKSHSVINGKSSDHIRKNSGTSEKISLARKQFEKGVSCTQSDFRSVLKQKPESSVFEKDRFIGNHDSRNKYKNEPVSNQDFKRILKYRQNLDLKEKQPLKISDHKSALNGNRDRKINAFESSEKDNSRTGPKRSWDSERDKLKLDLPTSSRNDNIKELTKNWEFKSVLKPNETDKLRSQETHNGDVPVLKPVPRRLSQTKHLSMDTNPRRLSQSKLPVGEIEPVFKDRLENKSVEYGSEVVLQCQVSGSPNPDISWCVNDKEIKVCNRWVLLGSERHVNLQYIRH